MINKKSYKQIIKLLQIVYDEETPRDAFLKAKKKFGKDFVSAYFFSKEIEGYIAHVNNPDRLVLTDVGLVEVQRYRKEKGQENLNLIIALTACIIALVAANGFLMKFVLKDWFASTINAITIFLLLACLFPIIKFLLELGSR